MVLEEDFLLLLSLDSTKRSQRSEPRWCLRIKDSSNIISLANHTLCMKEPITCSVILLPSDSCDEPNGIQLHIALQTKKEV